MSDEAHAAPSGKYAGENPNEETSFEQISFECMKFEKMGDLVGLCDKLIAGSYGSVARAKGVVKVHDEAIRFDVADNTYAITGGEEPFQTVIIGTDIDREKLFFEFGEFTLPQKPLQKPSGSKANDGVVKMVPGKR